MTTDIKRIDWDLVGNDDLMLIEKIAIRATGHTDRNATQLMMDLAATHLDCPLHLDRLLIADDMNFYHDILGIIRHLNRATGKLEGHFEPRSACPDSFIEVAHREVSHV